MLRRWRLISGLFLLFYLTTHALNHALGLAGRDALAAGRDAFLLLWRNPLAEGLLALALLVHLALALQALYRRRNLGHLRAWELAQLLLGLSIVPLLAIHVLGTVVAHYRFGTEDTYDYLYIVFVAAPRYALQQGAVLVIAWIHGSIGLWFWLRLKRGFESWRPFILALLILVPTLSIAGLAAGLNEVALLSRDQAWLSRQLAAIDPPNGGELDWIYAAEAIVLWTYGALLLAALALRALRLWRERRHGVVRIGYPGGLSVTVPKGTTILEASQQNRIPHASVCGGRGRCSTCRVRLTQGEEHLSAPAPEEARVLTRVGAGPAVRLACQTRPAGNVEVLPLLPATASPRDARPRPGYLQGEEREIAVLFADLRGFTTLAEQKLPYDVVFVLNRYFRGMAYAVEEAGGRVDKFIGDGVMALFGLETDRAEACRQAIRAAEAMSAELVEINRALAEELPAPLKIGIGIHVGPAIVGEMGAGSAVSVTAVGDTVNAASRIEALTKEFKAELVVSAELARAAGYAPAGARHEETRLRGRKEPLALLVVEALRPEPG